MRLLGTAAGVGACRAPAPPAPPGLAALLARRPRLGERMRALAAAEARGRRSFAALRATLRRPTGFAQCYVPNGQR